MESRIARLDVRASADERIADVVRRVAPGFAQRVMARCDQLMERRAPGRCVFIRRVDTRWRLRADRLDDDAEVDAVAMELADGVERELEAARDSPADTVSFASEIEYRAAYLRAVAEGSTDVWYFRPLNDERGHRRASGWSVSPNVTETVLAHLAEGGLLIRVLTALPDDTLDDIERALGTRNLTSAAASEEALDTTAIQPLTVLPDFRSLAAARIFCATMARAMTGGHSSEATVRAAARRMLAEIVGSRSPASADENGSLSPTRTAFRNEADSHRPGVNAGIATDRGGLFYFLSLALELSVAEIVWKACLPEPAFLARVAAALSGCDGSEDPAPELFGGVRCDSSLDPLDDDRLAEIAEQMLVSLADALMRREPAAVPPIEWCVAHARSGRLLLAVAAGTEFPLFAWPAASGSALQEGLRLFASRWPPGGPPQLAHPALADADRGGHVLARPTIPLSRPALLVDDDSLACAAALTQAAGTLAYVFVARAGAHDVRSPSRLVERYLSIPARVVTGRESMVIRLPGDRIDPSLRRAGLDRDPGWIPWLRSTVRFEYDELRDAGD